MQRLLVLIAGLLIVAALVLAPRLRRGFQERQHPAELHYRAGLTAARDGEPTRAVGEWKLAIALDPADPRPYDALIGYYQETGHPDLAVGLLETLARAAPTAPHQDCRMAQAAFAAGWITRAGDAADRAVRTEPGCPLGHTLRGIVLDDAGESADAQAELTRAHEIAPQDERISLTLAQLEGRSGHRPAALQRVREVLKADPGSSQARYLLGWLLAHAVPPTPATDAEAEKQLRRVLAQVPQHAGALTTLGGLYVRQGQFARARPLLLAGAQQDPADPELARSLAVTAARLGDPRAPMLAETARRLEQRQRERRELRHRHRLHPSDTATTLQLARVELESDQAREADDLARQVLRADPSNTAALALLHQMMQPAATP